MLSGLLLQTVIHLFQGIAPGPAFSLLFLGMAVLIKKDSYVCHVKEILELQRDLDCSEI